MKNIFSVGDRKIHAYTVKESDIARFATGTVHRVCSTFALGREMEWASRLFVLEMCDADEEGIGTQLEIRHKSPALVGETLVFTAEISSLSGNELLCIIQVTTKAGRQIAEGVTGQKILKREKIDRIFSTLNKV